MRLHEIELGVGSTEKSKKFYEMLGLKLNVDQPELKVFSTATKEVDFNVSNHFSAGTVCISFFTNDLSSLIQTLKENDISFEGPKPSHLNMNCIELKDPDGYLIRVNTK
jgi:catechol 2,3-dioxygenase-like lactoylglutathione lyase family enzyme